MSSQQLCNESTSRAITIVNEEWLVFLLKSKKKLNSALDLGSGFLILLFKEEC